jgi:dTDP-4-dehydrorhamnose 3,5-epimerase
VWVLISSSKRFMEDPDRGLGGEEEAAFFGIVACGLRRRDPPRSATVRAGLADTFCSCHAWPLAGAPPGVVWRSVTAVEVPVEVYRSKLEGLLLITPPRVYPDSRGFFVETYRSQDWQQQAGLPAFVQDNHSRSASGVLRGLHINTSGGGQGKLIRCGRGRIWDVAVDLRRDSPSFGRWEGFELDDERHQQVYVPPGFAHGFCVLSELADVVYKLTSYYDQAHEYGVAWNDPQLAVAWPVADPRLSKRDASNPSLAEFLERYPG